MNKTSSTTRSAGFRNTPRGNSGELAREIKINLVYGILLSNPNMRDGNPLFHSSHNNTGTGLAWGLTSYRTVRAKMAKQTENGRNIDLRLRRVIAPEELEFPVNQLLQSEENRGATGETGTRNPAQGTASAVFDARLDNGLVNPRDWYGAHRLHDNVVRCDRRRPRRNRNRLATWHRTRSADGIGDVAGLRGVWLRLPHLR